MKHRIRHEGDFQALYRRGRRIATNTLLVYSLPSLSGSTEYAIVVPNAVIALATKRNLVRRRIRSVLEHCIQQLRGKQVLVSVKKDVSRLPFSDLKHELLSVFGEGVKRTS